MPGPVVFKVVGVKAAAGDFPPRSMSPNLSVWVAPSFLSTVEGQAALLPDPYLGIAVRLRPGSSTDQFSSELTGFERIRASRFGLYSLRSSCAAGVCAATRPGAAATMLASTSAAMATRMIGPISVVGWGTT